MRIRMFLRLSSIALSALLFCELSHGKPCSKQEAISAEAGVVQLNSWQKIHSFYAKYRHCDDGAIAEGFTESVMRTLAHEWPSQVLFQLVSAEPAFKTFVLSHINESGSEQHLASIEGNAIKHCPSAQAKLCGEIIARVKASKVRPGPKA